jgi:PDZ domain
MHDSMKSSGRTMALILAMAPLGTAAARAQQAPRAAAGSRTQICVNGQCTDDSARVVVVRLMNKVDSLQRIFLGQPIGPEQQARMKAQIETMIRRLTDLQSNAVAFGLQQAAEATRQAMRDADQNIFEMQATSQAMQDAAPKGWLGFTTAGAPLEEIRDGEYYVRFLDYPEVQSVEPESPAQRAGILTGDLLMAFNGKDVTSHSISMTRLLEPDRKIVVRLERNGQPHEYSLIVAKAPHAFMMRLGDFSAARAPLARPGMPPDPAAPPVVAPRAIYLPKIAAAPPAGPTAWSGSVLNFDSERAPVAGAEMSTLNPDLARNLNLGVDHGVLVINAPSGTPAAQGGLRNADVIIKVAGDEVTSVRELRRVLERHGADSVIVMQIVREKQTRTLRVRND